MFNQTLNTIRAAKQSSRQINFPERQQLANPARAYPLVTKTNFRHFVGEETQFPADSPKQIDVALTIMTKGKPASQVNFLCVQSFLDDVAEEIFRPNHVKTPE